MSPTSVTEKKLLDLIGEEAWTDLKPLLDGMHPADVADIIDHAPSSARERIFDLLSEDIQPEVLAELEHRSGSVILESLSDREISVIVEEMAPDDAADLLGELPEDRSREVLSLMEKEESEEVRRLLTYDEDTAGGIMTTDVVAMREDQTVAEALNAIAYLDASERFVFAYIVSGDNTMIGYVDVWELLREKQRQRPLKEIVHRNYIAATVDTDQEEVARLIKQYDLSALPVVDHYGRLVGRVTADDVLDVIEEEASEDIFRLAGSDDADLERQSALASCWVRLPWLFVTLVGGFATSLILERFHSRISSVLVLAAFVPIVLAMGGNTGIQSSTLVVRRLALGGLRGQHIISRLLLREITAGAVMGLICGGLIGLWARFFVGSLSAENTLVTSPGHLAAVVGIALFSAMTFAAVFGAAVPMILHKVRIDPAVASGPFVTITNDIAALLIYFGVTLLLLYGLK